MVLLAVMVTDTDPRTVHAIKFTIIFSFPRFYHTVLDHSIVSGFNTALCSTVVQHCSIHLYSIPPYIIPVQDTATVLYSIPAQHTALHHCTV